MLLGAGEEWNTPRAPDFGANVQYHGNAMQYELIKRRNATFTSKSRVLRLAANLSGQKGHVQAQRHLQLEDKDGRTVLDVANDAILIWEDKKDAEIKSCRKRRLEMEITGSLGWDRANVEELDPYTNLPKLHEIKDLLVEAGATPGKSVKLPGYD